MKSCSSRKRSLRTLTSLALAGVALGGFASPASAQQLVEGFAMNRFEPSATGSEWFVNDTLDLRGTARPALGVVADYGYKPYVLKNADGTENTAIVKHQFFLHAGGSLTLFDALRLNISLPIALLQEGSPTGGVVAGTRIVSQGGAGIGDLRIGADVRLVGRYGDPFTLAFGGRVWAPTGSREKFLGDGAIRIGPHLAVAGDADAFAYAGNIGVVYRENSDAFAGHLMGTQVNFALAAGIRAAEKKLLIGPEVFGSSVVSEHEAFMGKRTTPLALLGSIHYTAGDVRLGFGAGPGLSRAAGTPIFRMVASLEYVPGYEEPKVAQPLPPPPPADRDGDGILDREDACPDVKGVRTEDPKTNGCPSDRDKDTILDTEDACPDVPGIRTEDPKTNGCPSDRDKDTILDTEDACPDVPGVRTDDPKTNGCPSDRDKDGILDTVDACPDVPGPANQDPKKNGCPVAYLKDNQIRITEQIKFRFNKAAIDPVSSPILEAVMKVIAANTDIKSIRVEGHTDNKGTPAYNKKLSDGRAAAVANWLVKNGVDRKKLTNVGHGLEKPIDTNDTEEGRANNRRVEFHVEMPPPAAKP